MNKKVITSDGSYTFYIEELDEHFRSKNGAVRESNHVFIKNGFEFWVKLNKKKNKCSIFEMGFGTGLNCLLTLRSNIKSSLLVKYNSVDAYPLKISETLDLNYEDFFKNETLSFLNRKILTSNWNNQVRIMKNFILNKNITKLNHFKHKDKYDLIFYDPFGYKVQPEMWTINSLEPIIKCLNFGGVFVTYSSKGSVKRILESFQLFVEKIKGPPGKREMLRAIKKI
ncbi:MAG: tRNA (5-methylaminomethyl-2-thiouridine)(34)-methyltransferase MnmD [Flavobacteriaceae bacterium]|nr:tRNA (5-methylaminomethyl-2-thiouridine)(34)-methyltransferase MnmD [Flavobacteriaceae bacterium]